MVEGAAFPEAWIRGAVFVAVFGALALFELWSPRLERDELRGALKSRRWFTNISMVILSSLVLRIVFPAAAVGAALWADERGWGLLRVAGVDGVVGGVIAFVVLDLAVWGEHLASHKIPLLWRIHRMHHADTGFDVTTGLRFHPLEIVLSMVWKAAVVIALGAPVLAVLIFEVVLNAGSMFSHSNIRIGPHLDSWLRRLIVTPDMHRVHHSSDRSETDSNYGFNLALWDRLFKTYVGQPKRGHEAMVIGLDGYRGGDASRLGSSLMLPFKPEPMDEIRRS